MHYYKRHLGDYAKKAGHLSPLEHGVYTLILDSYYDREQAPTEQDAMRWARARSIEEKEAVKAVLAEFFVLDGDRYLQNRVEEELEQYHGKAETNRAIAVERERRKRERRVHEVNTNISPDVHESYTSGQPNQEPLTKNHKKTVEARGTRLPEDWHPTPEETAFCKTERPDLIPSQVASRFFDHWTAQPGAKGRKTNWTATWRNWVRNEKAGPNAGRTPSASAEDWLRGAI